MPATVFYTGSAEVARLTNTFSVDSVATDPTTISLAITSPSGTSTTYTFAASEITKTGTGAYRKDIACTEAGIWTYTWTGTGTASDVEGGTWTVLTTAPNTYCTLAELKSRLGILATDTADDFEIALAVESASRWIDGYCDRRFWRSTETRTFEARDRWHVDVGDLVSVTTLKTDESGDGTFETTWTANTDYQQLPYNTTVFGETWPYDALRAVGSRVFPLCTGYARADRVQVVGVFGWPAIPANVKQSALILSADALKAKDAPFGVAGYGDYGPLRIRDNPVAVGLLRRYRRTAILVG